MESTVWVSGEGVAPSTTQTFTVDLGQRSLINAIRIKWDSMAFASLYWIEFSSTGKDWTIAVPQNLPRDPATFGRLPDYREGFVTTPIPGNANNIARLVRLVAAKPSKTNTTIAIASMEVLGHGDLDLHQPLELRECADIRKPGIGTNCAFYSAPDHVQ